MLKITSGKYEPIKGNYSEDIKDLVAELLNKEPQHRPSVQKILEKDFIKRRISSTLSKTICKYSETFNDKLVSIDNSPLKSSLDKSSHPQFHKRSLSVSIKESIPEKKVHFEKVSR